MSHVVMCDGCEKPIDVSKPHTEAESNGTYRVASASGKTSVIHGAARWRFTWHYHSTAECLPEAILKRAREAVEEDRGYRPEF